MGRLVGVLLVVALGAAGAAPGEAVERQTPYQVQIRLLGGLLRFELDGVMHERIDREGRRYESRFEGRGEDVHTLIESAGVLLGDRWVPRTTRLSFGLYGRQWSSEALHRPEQQTVEYRSRGESFFLGRVYTADEALMVPPDVHVDDVVTALLNFGEGRWPPGQDGRYATSLVRRGRAPRGAPGPAYRARLRPVLLTLAEDPGSRLRTGLVDLRGLTTWALPDRPARVQFDADARPAEVRLPLKLGTSVVIRLQPLAGAR